MHASTHISLARLRPPTYHAGLSRRGRLLRTLDRAGGKVLLVVAPAGFGKSTLLGSWIETLGDGGAWITLRQENDNLPSFLHQLGAALAPFHPAAGVGLQGSPFDEELLEPTLASEALLEAVECGAAAWKLVLDDYHVIRSAEIHAFILQLIDVMPENCRLVISSRSEPPLPIARMRMHGDMTLMTAEELRATTAECRAALMGLGVQVTSLQARAITDRTAGWFAALHLVAVAARSQSIEQVIQMLETFNDELDLLRDFLLQEILNQEPPEMQSFLLRIAVLDRFTVDTCYAITDDVAAGQYLERARRNGLFLTEIDDTRTWFRFHPMFRQFLLHELYLRDDPESLTRLHMAASNWFKLHNEDGEALSHAVKAGDWTAATKLIRSIAYDFLISHRASDLMRWLEAFPNDVKLADPDLSSITAFCFARQGRIAEVPPFLEAAESLWQKAGNNCGLAVVEIIRGEIARLREEGGKLVEHATRCLELAGHITDPEAATDTTVGLYHLRLNGTWMETTPHIMPFIQMALGLTLQGRITEGVRLAEEVLEFRKADDVDKEMRTVLAHVGHAYVAAGRFAEAETILGKIANDGLDEVPTVAALVVGALSEVMYSQNRVNECQQLLQEGIRLLNQRGMRSQDAPLQLQLARARWAQGDLDGTLEALNAATESANALQNARRLNEVYAFLVRIALAGGDVESARRWALMPRLAADPPEGSMSLPESLMLARIHIAEGDVEAVVELLERLRRMMAASGARYNLIHVLALLSLAYLDLFELEQAVQVLREALELGEAAQHVRVFIDDGSPMSRLLRIAHRRGVQVYYVNTLLKASGETPEKLTKFTHTDLIEPITAREIDVLELVALSLTNKEISEELYIAVSTVKRHITNLYGKLGVSSRTEAVQKARKLNLLASKQESATQLTGAASD